jgi:hypothetical protein
MGCPTYADQGLPQISHNGKFVTFGSGWGETICQTGDTPPCEGGPGTTNTNIRTDLFLVQLPLATATTTAITSAPNPSQELDQISLTATVTASNGTTPTGSVTFFLSNNAVGTVNLDGTGSAALTRTSCTINCAVTATYTGSADYMSSSGSLIQAVYQ